jgi:hypothetical protein
VLLVRGDDAARCRHEAGRATWREGRREGLDPSSLRPDARQQEGGARHQLSRAREVLGRRGADDGADVVQGALLAGAAEAGDHARDALPDALAGVGGEVLDIDRSGVGGAHEDEDGGAGCPQRLERVEAHVGADGVGVGAKPGDLAERGRGCARERLGVGLGGDVDVAALGVGEDDQALLARVVDRVLERAPAGRAEALEAGELGLDRDARGTRGVDRRRAVRGDRGGGALGRRSVRGRRRRGLWPQPSGVRIEPQDDLGLALGNQGLQPVCEMRTGRSPSVLRSAVAQPLTAFLRPEPAVKRGTFDAAIWMGSPVRGWTP